MKKKLNNNKRGKLYYKGCYAQLIYAIFFSNIGTKSVENGGNY